MQLDKKTKKQIETWIEVLRSGKFQQTQGALNNSEGYCCLGVGCKIFINTDKLQFQDGYIYGVMPFEQSKSPLWLHGINSDFSNKSGMSLTTINDGAILNNDSEKTYFSFNEIADLLQIVYIEGLE